MHHKGTKAHEEHKEEANRLSRQIVGAAIEVHRHLGPGLLESTYESALCHELELRGLRCQRQVPIKVLYKGLSLECGYRLDLLISETVIVEVKSVDTLLPIHEAQLLTYLRHAELWLGMLLNFGAPTMAQGIKRIVNG